AGQTTSDGKLTVTTTRCLGCCGLAPVVVLDNRVLAKQTPEDALNNVRTAVAKPAETVPGQA
ncbi:MAG: NAD(P)H-dependent oxidoreductase subunit E, partial [Desulfobacteraceae bacterium]|nr:NAD(P)H-dependent oxidoreductase subunit E [Desulfobacteraceae bacterium]